MMQNVGSSSTEREAAQQGLAGVLMRMLRNRWRIKSSAVRKLQVIETLSLGGKKQISLVRCGTERFLVGGGLESVTTIVKLENIPAQDGTQVEPCK